ncbi:Aste57867_16014 [Aphanomyces stellatus]|uniref:Aste57867_16014 protein n=1 Tax=Aphanomyces stellatus TaxID=120398 RepID=A0A485L6C4_9STRA|nr:hypothetical protein As57867_015958 [Aphanomyces stellatus]VFT92799.1 Aste57867_16014 [Aphanomyces stellatus]
MVLRKKHGVASSKHMATKKEEPNEGDANQETGLSLDAYFNSKKEYTVATMKETSELLEKKEAKLKHDNAMVMCRDEEDDEMEHHAMESNIPICPMHDGDTEEDPYEDDYESDHGDAKETTGDASAVAGLTLSDYLTHGAKPKEKKKPKKPDTEVAIEGMSLESYLGASSSVHDDEKLKKKKAKGAPPPMNESSKKQLVSHHIQQMQMQQKKKASLGGSKKLENNPGKKASENDVLLFKRDKTHMDKASMHSQAKKTHKHHVGKQPHKKHREVQTIADDDDDDADTMTLFHPLPVLMSNRSGTLDQPTSISEDDEVDVSRLPPLPH